MSRSLFFNIIFGILFFFLGANAIAIEAYTLPEGGQITQGEAVIHNPSLGVLNVDQISNSATIEWNTFNVGEQASVHFNQPTDTASIYNNVLNGTSSIYGKVFANGKLFLHNPTGIYIGPYAAVKGQGVVLSTLNLIKQDTQAQEYYYSSPGSGQINNQGLIESGYVALISPSIHQAGTIQSAGDTHLAASDAVYLKINPDSQLLVKVNPATMETAIENQGTIEATNGQVYLQSDIAQSFVDQTIQRSTKEATALVKENGVLKLVSNSGSIQSTNITLSSGAQGQTVNSGDLIASSNNEGGKITLEGKEVLVNSKSQLIATGYLQGGTILIGGDWQGEGELLQANYSLVEKNTLLDVSSIGSGDGGKIVIWSDIHSPTSKTIVHGTLKANSINGQGGKIETSGYFLNVDSIKVDTSSIFSNSGLWLLDPYDITISSSSSSGTSYADTFEAGAASNIDVSVINSSLDAGNNISITTGTTGSGGDITVTSAISSSGIGSFSLTANSDIVLDAAITTGGDISMTAGDNIIVNHDITHNASSISSLSLNGSNVYVNADISATAGKLNVNITSDASSGYTALEGDITTNGGTVSLNGALTSFQATSNQTVNTSISENTGGKITFNNPVQLSISNNGAGGSLTINSGGGEIDINSTLTTGSSVTRMTSLSSPYLENYSSGDIVSNWQSTRSGHTLSVYDYPSGHDTTLGYFVGPLGSFRGDKWGVTNTNDNPRIYRNFTGTSADNYTIAYDFYQFNSFDGGCVKDCTYVYVNDTEALRSGDLANFHNNTSYSGSSNGYSWTATRLSDIGTNYGSFGGMNGSNSWIYNDSKWRVSITTPSITLNSLKLWQLQNGNMSDESWGFNNISVSGGGLSSGGSSTNAYSLGNNQLILNSGQGVIDVSGDISNLSDLTVTSSQNATIAGIISGSGALTKSGTGALSLSAVNTFTGNINLNEGELVVSGSGQLASGSYSGDIINQGIFEYGSTATQILSGIISGTGDLEKTTSTSNLNLTGANTYSGNTTISSGTLTIGSGGSLGSRSYAGRITNSDSFVYSSSINQTLSGTISGSGTLTQSGSGSLTLSGNNSYTGSTYISSANLIAGHNGSLGNSPTIISSSGILSVSSGITLPSISTSNSITLNSGITTTGTQYYGSDVIVSAGSVSDPVEFTTTNSNITFNETLKADSTGKSRSITFDAGTANLIFNDRIGYAFNDVDFNADLTADSFYKMIFNAGGITLKGDVMTFEEQVYNGPVYIGSNDNGTSRTLLSMDPKVTFNSTIDDTIANTHSLIAKAIEVRREGETATTPEVNFLSYVGNTKALSSYSGLTGYQVIDEVFGNIDTSISFGTVTAAPVIITSSSSSTSNNQAKNKAKKASANAGKSIKPDIKSNSRAATSSGPSIKQLKIKTIDISFPAPAPKNTNQPTSKQPKIKTNDISFPAPAPKNTDQQTSGNSRGTRESASDTSSSDSAPATKNTDQQTSGDSRGTRESASDTSSSDNTTDSSDQSEEGLEEEEESGSIKS